MVYRDNPVFQAGFPDEPVLWRTIKTRKSDSGAFTLISLGVLNSMHRPILNNPRVSDADF